MSWTKTKARRAGGAHALPRRSWPARPATFSKFTCIPGREDAAGRNLQRRAIGRAAAFGRAGGGGAARARCTMGAAERARGQRGPGLRAAARLARPGRRMRRWRLGTDAPRARCMLMAGGRAMNYSAAARRERAWHGGRPGPRVPLRCEAAAATSQTFPGRHRGCGPRGASVPARARRPRFPRCRLFYVFCLGVGTCPRERVSLPTPSPPDRGGGGGTGDPERRGCRVGGARLLPALQPRETAWGLRLYPRTRAPLFRGEVKASTVPRIPTRPPGAPGHAHCRRGQGAAPPRLPPPLRTLLLGPARAGGAGGASSGFAARAPRLAPQPRVRAPAGTPPRALPARAPPARGPARLHMQGRGYNAAGT